VNKPGIEAVPRPGRQRHEETLWVAFTQTARAIADGEVGDPPPLLPFADGDRDPPLLSQ